MYLTLYVLPACARNASPSVTVRPETVASAAGGGFPMTPPLTLKKIRNGRSPTTTRSSSNVTVAVRRSTVALTGAGGVTSPGGRQSTLCAGLWPRPACDRAASAPVAAERMVPPFNASVSASTATPRVEMLGSATLCANTSAAVPLPLS